MPEGADFATWFLEDAQRVIAYTLRPPRRCCCARSDPRALCRRVHRHSEGLQQNAGRNGFIKIEDTHAHAWVEVFDPSILEGCRSRSPKARSSPANQPHPNLASRHFAEDENTQTTPEPTAEPTPTPTPEPTPEHHGGAHNRAGSDAQDEARPIGLHAGGDKR
jgi:cell division septation protein DedD